MMKQFIKNFARDCINKLNAKKIYSHILFINIIISILGCISITCNNIGDDYGVDSGALIINISTSQSKSNTDIASYAISGIGPNGAEFNEIIFDTTLSINDLALGNWEIVVDAKNTDNIVVGNASEDIVVLNDVTTTVDITVMMLYGNGTIYFIDPEGNDNNDGLSEENAWATITKVNAMSFEPGDTILFKRGKTWKIESYGDRLEPQSGSIDQPISYGAYGSGAKPIITAVGAYWSMNNEDSWSYQGNSIWTMTLTKDPIRIFLSNTEFIEAETIDEVNATNRWFWENNTLSVYSLDNPASTLEGSYADNYAILLKLKNNVNIYNLDLRGGYDAIRIIGSTNIHIDNCNVGLNSTVNGISIHGFDPNIESSYCVISNCTIESGFENASYNYGPATIADGISIFHNTHHCSIYNNTVSNWNHSGIGIENLNTVSPIGVCNYHEVYDNIITAPNTNYCRGIGIENASTQDGACSFNKIYRNLIKDTSVSNQIGHGDNNEFYYNVIDTVSFTPYSIRVEKKSLPTGIAIFKNGKNNTIYNNIIYNTDYIGISVTGDPRGEIEGCLIENNIIMNFCMSSYADINCGLMIQDDETGSVLSNIYRNNCVYKNGADKPIRYAHPEMSNPYSPSYYKNHSAYDFNLLTEDEIVNIDCDIMENNFSVDPLFIYPENGNFHLQADSHCLDVGIKDIIDM
ncbi:MAG: hypothetical protein SVZ03_02440 [Spirochaetota bacterium]|nr:hypothetical protein [Spirochaetota bacterium]